MAQNDLTFTPLGGLGRIGANMNLIQRGNTRVILDCGILFPDDNPFNIDYLIPDYSHISPPTDLILTHAHEDHLGGLRLLLKRFPQIKVHAPQFAKALIEAKGIKVHVDEYQNKQMLNFDNFIIQPLKVDHSIPDTYGVLLKTEELGFFYLSDFKIYIKNTEFDLEWLKQEMESYGKRILFADSTNILSRNLNTKEEEDLEKPLSTYFNSKGRLFITFFASNSFRLRTILKLAKEYKRTVVTYGSSMANYYKVANKTGFLEEINYGIHDVDEVDIKDPSLVILVSGCQGDFKSAVRRIAYSEDKYFKLGKNDTFLFSSKSIPGNEAKIATIYNKIVETGAEIITSQDDFVHVSGHPGKDDLKKLYKTVDPTHFIPIHGESYFLKRHKEFFDSLYPNSQSSLLLNGDELNCHKWKIKQNEEKDPTLVQINDLPISKDRIKEKRKIAQGGIILISLIRDRKKFQITYQGLNDVIENKLIQSTVDRYLKSNKHYSSEELRILVRKAVSKITGIKPEVFIHDF